MSSAVCRACLASDVQLYRALHNKLLEIYEKLVGPELNKVRLPDTVCQSCLSELARCLRFSHKAKKSERVLISRLHKGIECNEDEIEDFDEDDSEIADNSDIADDSIANDETTKSTDDNSSIDDVPLIQIKIERTDQEEIDPLKDGELIKYEIKNNKNALLNNSKDKLTQNENDNVERDKEISNKDSEQIERESEIHLKRVSPRDKLKNKKITKKDIIKLHQQGCQSSFSRNILKRAEDREVNLNKRKKRGKWDPQNLLTAINKVMSKNMSLGGAALLYDIPKSTLHDKVLSLYRGEEVTIVPKMGRFSNTFSLEYEQVLVEHVKDLTKRCLPLSKQEFLRLAFDLAETSNIPHRFNKQKGAAGKKFYSKFIQNHPNLLIKAPNIANIQMDVFYDNLERLFNLFQFKPSNIYNYVQIEVNSRSQKESKVEKAIIKTVLFCVNASSQFIPPFVCLEETILINSPVESVGMEHDSNNSNFLLWLQHFIKNSRPESPVLLIAEGQSIHKTLAVINFCQENSIHIINSFNLQPLEKTFIKPFKDAYKQRCDMLSANGCKMPGITDIAGLVNEAYTNVQKNGLEIADGFKTTGIYPFDRHIAIGQV